MRISGDMSFEMVTLRMSRMTYREIRKRRNEITADIANGWVYRAAMWGKLRPRDRSGDRLVVAWLNAEMNRRIWADPLVSGGAVRANPNSRSHHKKRK